jgi:membrane associated rhomboid family serine protease
MTTTLRVRRALRTHVRALGVSLGALWIGYAAVVLSGGGLLAFGVVPRTSTGLLGIVAAPFLHANLTHLLANTLSFAVLGWLVMWRDPRHFWQVTVTSLLTAGLAAWLLGAPHSVHVGASGLVFGYLGFLMLSGWYARTFAAVALSVVVTAAWGGLVFGVLPGAPGVSWPSHLGGFAGGVLLARAYRRG